MRRVLAVAVVLLLAIGCGSGGDEFSAQEQMPAADRTTGATAAPTEDGEQTLVFVADDIFYDDPPTTARAGTLTIVLDNVGAAQHNIVFEGFNDEQPVAEADGGGRDEGTITLEPGEYVFYCSIPGHRAAGMEGVLTVTP